MRATVAATRINHKSISTKYPDYECAAWLSSAPCWLAGPSIEQGGRLVSATRNLNLDESVEPWTARKRGRREADWLAVFRRRRIGERLTSKVIAYRGAINADGMSWSSSRHIAHRFSRTHRGPVC